MFVSKFIQALKEEKIDTDWIIAEEKINPPKKITSTDCFQSPAFDNFFNICFNSTVFKFGD